MPRCGLEGFAAVAIDRPGCLAVSDAARSGGIGVELSRAVSVETRKGKLHRAASTCEQTKMMALRDRLHAIQFGIVAGVPAHEHDGETLLYSIDVPYEFRDCIQQSCVKGQKLDRWSPDSRQSVMRRSPEIFWLAYTWHGWEACRSMS